MVYFGKEADADTGELIFDSVGERGAKRFLKTHKLEFFDHFCFLALARY